MVVASTSAPWVGTSEEDVRLAGPIFRYPIASNEGSTSADGYGRMVTVEVKDADDVLGIFDTVVTL